MNLFIASLPWAAREQDLVNHFSTEGEVMKCKIVRDHDTNKSKGFAFLTMESTEAAQRAIREFNGRDFMGRKIVVKEAEDRR